MICSSMLTAILSSDWPREKCESSWRELFSISNLILPVHPAIVTPDP